MEWEEASLSSLEVCASLQHSLPDDVQGGVYKVEELCELMGVGAFPPWVVSQLGLAVYVLVAAFPPWVVSQWGLVAYVLVAAFPPWVVSQLGLVVYVLVAAFPPWVVSQLGLVVYVLVVAFPLEEPCGSAMVALLLVEACEWVSVVCAHMRKEACCNQQEREWSHMHMKQRTILKIDEEFFNRSSYYTINFFAKIEGRLSHFICFYMTLLAKFPRVRFYVQMALLTYVGNKSQALISSFSILSEVSSSDRFAIEIIGQNYFLRLDPIQM
ncbi:hypothetical protein RJ641_003891 [Dillenia turbinata]|uniref:Uncharacterized protein n=1 Tax=Dillenia turbinata TaxID=194707 RepID=A0AAN8VI28_9MAGN